MSEKCFCRPLLMTIINRTGTTFEQFFLLEGYRLIFVCQCSNLCWQYVDKNKRRFMPYNWKNGCTFAHDFGTKNTMMKERLNNILATTAAMPMGVDKIIFFID